MSLFKSEEETRRRALNYPWNVQAVYGGRIPGGKSQTIKTNPVYEAEHCDNTNGNNTNSETNQDTSTIRVDLYELSTIVNMRGDTKVGELFEGELKGELNKETGEKLNNITANYRSTVNSVNSHMKCHSSNGSLRNAYRKPDEQVDKRITESVNYKGDSLLDTEDANANGRDINSSINTEFMKSELDNRLTVDNATDDIVISVDDNQNETPLYCYQNRAFEENGGDRNDIETDSERQNSGASTCDYNALQEADTQTSGLSQIVTKVFVHNPIQSDLDTTVGDNNIGRRVHDDLLETLKSDTGESLSTTDWPDINDIALPLENVTEQSEIDGPKTDSSNCSKSFETEKTMFSHELKVNEKPAVLDFSQYLIDNSKDVKNTSTEEPSMINCTTNDAHNIDLTQNSDELTNSADKTDTLISCSSSKFEFDNTTIDESTLESSRPKQAVADQTTDHETIDHETIDHETIDHEKSPRTLKSILTNSTTEGKTEEHTVKVDIYTRSNSEIQETKTVKTHVKFSDDTVFNENRANKYKHAMMERVNLREIYRGRISSDSAVAKLNPLFRDDGEDQGSMTDDEKVAYKISLKAIMDGKGQDTDMTGSIEQPVYDKLIRRTIAKARRKLIIKWALVLMIVLVITIVATVIGVHFKKD